MSKNIVIAAGGTGGHLFPAQALASELKQRIVGCNILFVAKGLQTNPYFASKEFAFSDISASTLSLCPRKLLKAAVAIPRGIWQSYHILKKFSPDLIVGFGSFHTFPVLCAASLLKIPFVLHVADCVPGRVNRLFASRAEWTGVFFPEAAHSLKGTVYPTSIPLRPQFDASIRPTKREAIAYFGLSDAKKTLLVFGGSQGARALNQLVVEALKGWQAAARQLQVLHFTGTNHELIQKEYDACGITARVKPFEPAMSYAWAACDLVISRAGACSIAEQLAFAVPALLIPFPYAQDQHQKKNAQYMQQGIGGGRYLEEKSLTAGKLLEVLQELLEPSTASLMKQNLQLTQRTIESCAFSEQIVNFLVAR